MPTPYLDAMLIKYAVTWDKISAEGRLRITTQLQRELVRRQALKPWS